MLQIHDHRYDITLWYAPCHSYDFTNVGNINYNIDQSLSDDGKGAMNLFGISFNEIIVAPLISSIKQQFITSNNITIQVIIEN